MRTVAGLLAAFLLGGAAEAAAPQFQGRWKIDYCAYPDKVCGADFVCIDAVKAPGLVVGMPIGGTFSGHYDADGFLPLAGRWVQHGDAVQLFGRFTSPQAPFFVSYVGILGQNRMTGTLVDANNDLASFTAVGTFQASRVPTCPTPSLTGGRRK